MPKPERAGDDAPSLEALRNLYNRGLVSALPWRITKAGREALAENEPQVPTTTISFGLKTLAEIEREAIFAAVEHCKGNRTHAARQLGVSVRTIRDKLKSYQVLGILPTSLRRI